MGSGSVHHYAGLFLFFPAFLQLTAGPGVFGHCAVDQIRIAACVGLQLTLCFDRLVLFRASCSHYRAVLYNSLRGAGQFVAGAAYAEGGGNTLAARSHVQHARIVADSLIAQGHHAHIARAVDIRLLNFSRSIVLNVIMAAGTACDCCSFHSHRSPHGHAGDFAFGSTVNIQVPQIHSRGVLFIRIGHTCRSGIFDAVHPCRHNPGQESVRPGKLQSRRPGLQGGRSVRFHGHQRRLAAAIFVYGGILQPCRIVFENIGIRPDALGGKFRAFHQPCAYGCRGRFGSIRSDGADYRRFAVLFHGRNIRIVDLSPNSFSSVAGFGSLVAFR